MELYYCKIKNNIYKIINCESKMYCTVIFQTGIKTYCGYLDFVKIGNHTRFLLLI